MSDTDDGGSPPSLLGGLAESCAAFLADYGWYLLLLTAVLLYLRPRLLDFLDDRYAAEEEARYAAMCHKDPDWVKSRSEGVDEARRRMQDELDRKSAEYAARLAEREERKRAERYRRLDGGTRLGGPSDSDNKYKPGYSPLSGDHADGYRPTKKTSPGGGGCAGN